MNEFYVGSTWRSRFLRAPKVAFELADRRDFVRVDELATAQLGLKTGCDEFFYVSRVEASSGRRPAIPRRSAGRIRIRGLKGSWEGDISVRDVVPAILNPHQLMRRTGRAFVVPRQVETLYLLPRDRAPTDDLADYVRVGERAGINRRRLVQGNASESRWYRQARGIVRSRWALPYSSAYDYGAFDNSVGAVLNGRFVGVEPVEDVDPDVLGAVLNSTFAVVGRLLEGTATGVEGAFDVGPPAVRKMKVPDVRRISDACAERIRDIIGEMRSQDVMPSSPDRNASVDRVRHRLDIEILRGLGRSAGEASAIVGRVYEKYARWRAAVEDVEAMMRRYRREMSRQGRARSARPVDIAARRIWDEIEHTVRAYPGDLLSHDEDMESVYLPRRIRPPAQKPLLQPGFLPVGDGKGVDLGSYDRVRYAALLASLGFEPPYDIPRDSDKAGAIVDAFTLDMTKLRSEVGDRARAFTTDGRTVDSIVHAVQRLWFRKSRALGMTLREVGSTRS